MTTEITTLPIECAYKSSWRRDWREAPTNIPEGVEVTSEPFEYEHEGETHQGTHYFFKLPEADDYRLFDREAFYQGVVVPINGQNYRIIFSLDEEDDGSRVSGSVTFIPTDAPVSEFQTWSEDVVREDYLRRRRVNLERSEKELAKLLSGEKSEYVAEHERWVRRDIEQERKDIADTEAGLTRFRPTAYANFFGQPNYLQGEVIPVHEGRSGMCLVTLETEWGDAGNINIFFACDENGVPCRVWYEASCC